MTQQHHAITLGVTNCYLLPLRNGNLLIDTSFHNTFDSFRHRLSQLRIDIDTVKYLFLTHHHDDHAGFVAEMQKTGCRLILHQDAVLPLKNGENQDQTEPLNRRVKTMLSLFGRNKFTYPSVTVGENDITITADDTEILRSMGMEGKILVTPGHTRDSISLVLEDGQAFVGDAAMNFLGYCGVRHRPIMVEDLGQTYQSWEKLISAGARMIFPGHGKPFAVDHLLRVLKEVKK